MCGLSQICALTAYRFTLQKESWRHLVLICLICLAHIEIQERVAIFAARQEGHQNYRALFELIATSSCLLPSDTVISVKHQQVKMKMWAYFFFKLLKLICSNSTSICITKGKIRLVGLLDLRGLILVLFTIKTLGNLHLLLIYASLFSA